MMEEKVFFDNGKGDKIYGVLLDKKSSLIVVICHGLTSSKDGKTAKGICDSLGNEGISTFRIDIFAHGESEGKFEDLTISEAVNDILFAIEFVKKKGYEQIMLVGSSFGGISSLMAASRSNDLKALALRCPVSNYEDKERGTYTSEELETWKRAGFRMKTTQHGTLRQNYTFFEDFKNNNGYEAAAKIVIPTLIVHGDKDEVVPVGQSMRTSKIIKDCQLEIIEDADHTFSDPELQEKGLELITRFILEHS